MKKKIISILSILAISPLLFAKPCTTESVGNSAGESKETTWASGQGTSQVVIAVNYTFGKVAGTISQDGHVVNILGVKNGNFIYDDLNDEYGTWDISCEMNQNNNIMITDGSLKFVLRSSFPTTATNVVKSAPAEISPERAQQLKDLGDWAPEPPKQQAAPVKIIQSSSGKQVENPLGNWAK